MADEPFFVSKPSGHEVKPLGVAKEFTLSAMDDRNREQWALYSSFLMVASLLVDVQSSALASSQKFEAPVLIQAEHSALLKKAMTVTGKDFDLANPSRVLIDNQTALFSVDSSKEQGKRITHEEQLLVEQSLDSGLRAMATEFRSLTSGDAAALDLEGLSSSPLRSLIEQVARGVGKSFNEVATVLQTIYGHLDFILGTRQTPFEPILGPLIESPAGQAFIDLLSIGRQFPGPKTPDFEIEGLARLDGATNSLYIGGENLYLQSSLNRSERNEKTTDGADSVSGLLEFGAMASFAGINWQEGLHLGNRSTDGGELLIAKTGNIDQDNPVALGQEITALEFLSLSGDSVLPEDLGSTVSDFLPYDIDLESAINGSVDLLTLRANGSTAAPEPISTSAPSLSSNLPSTLDMSALLNA